MCIRDSANATRSTGVRTTPPRPAGEAAAAWYDAATHEDAWEARAVADGRRDAGRPRGPGGHPDLQPARGAQRDDVGHVRPTLRGVRGGGRRRLRPPAGAA